MRYTQRLATFFRIPVRVHFTFPLVLVFFGVEGWLEGGWREAFYGVFLVTAVFVCVVLHELGHSLQARRFGVGIRDIVLLPIGGMARVDRIPESPRKEILIAVSGPLVNFGLAGVILVSMWLSNSPLTVDDSFVSNLFLINLALGVFNLVPAFPMDGGRILRGLLAVKYPYVRATRYATGVGQLIALLFALLGFVYTKLVMLPLIAVFIFFGAVNEEKMIRAKALERDGDLPRRSRADGVR
jgi:stage IV sporulation protein FB